VAHNRQEEHDTMTDQPITKVRKSFTLYSDVLDTLQKALEKAKKDIGTDVDTVALDYIMLSYLHRSGS